MMICGRESVFSDFENNSDHIVVAVHGAISDARVWKDVATNFCPKFCFVAYTQRYFGVQNWDDNGQNFSLETHVNDLIDYVEAIKKHRNVHLLTWSYGGEVALYAAIKRPDLFTSMAHYEPSALGIVADEPSMAAAGEKLPSGNITGHSHATKKLLKSGCGTFF